MVSIQSQTEMNLGMENNWMSIFRAPVDHDQYRAECNEMEITASPFIIRLLAMEPPNDDDWKKKKKTHSIR